MSPLRSATGWLHERPTIDVVVLVLVGVVALIMLSATATVAVLAIVSPELDTDEVVALLDTHTGTILGALLGLVAGQNAERYANRSQIGR